MFPSSQLPGPLNQPKASIVNQQRSSDKKCNVVFYGIAECTQNTSRSQSDLKNIHLAVPNIEDLAIKDLHQHPTPLLVQFLCALDAQAVLYDRNKFSPRILPKTPEERNAESLLLKERWKLIQQGHPHNIIKICNANIYVNNHPYSIVINSKFNQLTQFVPLTSYSTNTDQPEQS